MSVEFLEPCRYKEKGHQCLQQEGSYNVCFKAPVEANLVEMDNHDFAITGQHFRSITDENGRPLDIGVAIDQQLKECKDLRCSFCQAKAEYIPDDSELEESFDDADFSDLFSEEAKEEESANFLGGLDDDLSEDDQPFGAFGDDPFEGDDPFGRDSEGDGSDNYFGDDFL